MYKYGIKDFFGQAKLVGQGIYARIYKAIDRWYKKNIEDDYPYDDEL